MSRGLYGVGTVLYSNATFSDPDSTVAPIDTKTGRTLLDPAAVSCAVTLPDRTTVTYTYGVDAQLTRLGQGQYRCSIDLDSEGSYRWKWAGVSGTRAVVVYGEADAT